MISAEFKVVSYFISTSNHNFRRPYVIFIKLYLISFLHQTTTRAHHLFRRASCILFHFYIKPQQTANSHQMIQSCILFHFYIKPQLLLTVSKSALSCILFHFYIKPQLIRPSAVVAQSCILFHFYIKPQLSILTLTGILVVSYFISTSNHNSGHLIRLFSKSHTVLAINKMNSELPVKCI